MADPLGHAAHDPLLVASAVGATGDIDWPRTCPPCSELFRDLLALRAAVPSATIPPRPRDFGLTATEAARLRPGWIRRAFHGIGGTRDIVTRPLAASFLGLGMAGLIVGMVPGSMPAPSGAAGGDGLGSLPGATPAGPSREHTILGQPNGPAKQVPHDAAADPSAGTSGPNPLTLLSAGLLAAGGGLLGVRRLASAGSSVR